MRPEILLVLLPLLLCGSVMAIPQVERDILQHFMDSFPALASQKIGWTLSSADPCMWSGVHCDPVSGNISQLTFDFGPGLMALPADSGPAPGTIPESIGNFSSVFDTFIIREQPVNGTIPSSIGRLKGLSVLEIYSVPMVSTIPESIYSLSNLQILRIHENHGIWGTISPLLGNLTALTDLRLDEQNLTAPIPDVFDKLPNLGYLNLSRNKLTGTIPHSLCSARNLVSLFLNECELSGTLPPNLADLTKMEVIFLYTNSLNGTIPANITTWKSIQEILFFENQLTGTLPVELFSIPSLKKLQVYTNNLSGCFYQPEDKVTNSTTIYNFAGQSNKLLCSCSGLAMMASCPYCNGISCTGAHFFEGSLCSDSSQCEHICNGTCVPAPPDTGQAGIQGPNIGSMVVGVVVAIVFIGVGATVGFILWRRHKRSTSPGLTAASVWLELEDQSQHSKSSGIESISLNEFAFMQELGKGSSGTVHLATYQGEFVAVKRIGSDGNSDDGLKSLQFEADVMSSIRGHRNVVRLIGLCDEAADKAIVMEFCPRGSLSNYLKKHQTPLAEYELFKFTYGIASGMAALAMANVVHRDLACRNVLLSDNMFAKVSDFGYSSKGSKSIAAGAAGDSLGPVKWQSPELLKSENNFSEKSDVWAFGCTMIELLTCREPYAGFTGNLLQLVAEIRDSGFNPLMHIERLPESKRPIIPEWMYSVLRSCFSANPDQRPTFREIRYHLSRSAKHLQNQLENEEDEADSLLGTRSAYTTVQPTADSANRNTASSWQSGVGLGDKSSAVQSDSSTSVLFKVPLGGLASTIDLDNVERLGKLGAGSFGAVYLGITQGSYVALKVLSVQGSEREAIQEASLMMNIQPHRNIIQLYGMISQQQQLTIVMEFAPKGALESLLKAHKAGSNTGVNMTEGLLFKWAIGIARGMAGLAASKIIHRDLAVRNILLDASLEPKIADFGLARTVLDPNQESSTKCDIGPVRWFAPECYSLKYSEKTDVWAYGCTLVEMLTADVPLAHLKLMDVVEAVRNEGRTPLEAFMNPDGSPVSTVPGWMIETMRKCFAFDPKDRLNFSELVSHLESVGHTIREVREAEAEIQKRRERRADVRGMQIQQQY